MIKSQVGIKFKLVEIRVSTNEMNRSLEEKERKGKKGREIYFRGINLIDPSSVHTILGYANATRYCS